jgi:hypothetical protein
MIVLLFVGPATSAAAACAGWSNSAAERMACCQATAGHCAAISADECCASSEQRRNLEGVALTAITPDDGPGTRLMAVRPTRRAAETAHRAAPGRPDTYLLDSIFLI